MTEGLDGSAHGQTLTFSPGLSSNGSAVLQDVEGQYCLHAQLLLLSAPFADVMLQRSNIKKWKPPDKYSWLYLFKFVIDLLPGTGSMTAITMLVFSLLDTMLFESWLIVL